MTKTQELTCIRCPMGCALHVELEDGAVAAVAGNTCSRGAEYGRSEVTHPMRTVTSTVRVAGGIRPVVPCRTAAEIPKEKIFDVMAQINALCVTAPVAIGDILLSDAAGTGIPVIATAPALRAGPLAPFVDAQRGQDYN